MDQAGIIDSDDSNIEQARGCKSTGIVKTGMMERAERQVVTILEHGTLDRAHATTSVGNGKLLRRGSHTTTALGHNLRRHLVGHVGGKGTGTPAVAKHVHTRKAHAAAQRQRLLKLLVRLAGKPTMTSHERDAWGKMARIIRTVSSKASAL